MKKTSYLLLSLCFFVAGCATTKGYEMVLDSWVGGSERELIDSWGSPDNVYQLDNHQRILTYQSGGSAYIPGTSPSYLTTVSGNTATTTPYGGSPGFVIQKSCKTEFTLVDGIIERWRWQGNSCRAVPPKKVKKKTVATGEDGKRDGANKTYYKDGQIKSEEFWKNGKQDGLNKFYFESGKLKAEMSYRDDKKDGPTKSYYETGNLEFEGVFKNDKQEGLWKYYYPSGKLQSEMIYKNDKPEAAKIYYESGKLKEEKSLKDGKQEGVGKTYYENGQLETEMFWRNDLPEGIGKQYSESGKLLTELLFENGRAISKKEFDEAGKLKG